MQDGHKVTFLAKNQNKKTKTKTRNSQEFSSGDGEEDHFYPPGPSLVASELIYDSIYEHP